MGDQLRIKLISGVILVIVFAAGGLVGAAVSQPSESDEMDTGAMASAESGEEAGNPSESGRGSRQRPRYMFEIAGATEEQEAFIHSEILPEWRRMREELDEDSTVVALEARSDSIERDFWRAHRELEAYYDPLYDEILDETRAAIRAVLNPEAQRVYDSLVVERNRRGSDDRR